MSVATRGNGGAGPGGGGAAGQAGGENASECIHSGHFMVSQFEAEAQEDEEPPPRPPTNQPILAIDTSLNNLFQCMSLAYRQKLTSPKWNRFKGVKLRWKDKIRLNNVIWRCWHMQFIMKQNTLVCQFASPLDVDTHTKPETTLLEGKYWKRRAEAVIAEYKKWRMYYRNMALGWNAKDVSDVIPDVDIFDWQSQGDSTHMLVDEDYISFMSDTLFSTISNNQPFAFPDTREIARGASLADFIQPSLGPLQPNLEDFMDTLEPLQDLFTVKLPPVPEESSDDSVYRHSFTQSIMDSNLQSLNNTSYPITSMPMQHLNLSQQSQHHQNTHSNMLQSSNNQIISQEPIISGLQSMPQSLENQQSTHNAIIISRQNHNHDYNIQANSNSQIDLSPTVITPSQSQSMMLQSYNIMNPGLQNQILTHQSIIPNNQEMSKPSHQYVSPQKMYHQIPVSTFHERNYNILQGSHQNRSDIPYNTGMSRRISGSGGCIRERVSRQRPSPLVPPNSASFNQYNSPSALLNSSQNLAEKSYGEHIHEQGIITSSNNMPQSVNLTAGIYLSNIGGQTEQSLSGNSSSSGNQAIPRFKMPSPPPQITNSTIIALPQISNTSTSQQHISKGENFRSNSLPIGATLGSVLGTTRAPRPRRPRSGSGSPAPPRRAPLNTAASEPSLNPNSVLLAHLLTSKSQEMYKPSSMQSLTSESSNIVNQQILPVTIVSAPTSALLTTKIPPSSPQLSSFGASSPTSAASPQSPPSPLDGSGGSGKEHRRAGHIHAEQKRRYNIKNGFDLLQSLIPQLAQNPNAKVSKAAMLQKGAEYIKQLQGEQNQIKDEIEGLRNKIEYLDNSISNCQSLLPATGAPVSRQRSGKLKEMFDDYVCQRTNENWKFWIFSLLIEPLLSSFNNCVSQASTEELKRSTLLWAEQHCSLVELRPAVLHSLRNLCTTTDILSNPEKLPEEAQTAVNKKNPKEP